VSAPATLVIPGVPVGERRHSRVLQSPLAVPRSGVMLHYDDSARDDWAVAWFSDPRCMNGYTWLVLDDGMVVELADPATRTPHAGACSVANANSRYYGISAATNGLVPATPAQVAAIVATCVAVFRLHRWGAASALTQIVGHDALAVWTPALTRAAGISDARARGLWGKTGRKVDPTGRRADGRPVLDVGEVRAAVAAAVGDRGGDDARR
jgi:N-acetyl-anhydromuramyl-L-alanine amidase AmpD